MSDEMTPADLVVQVLQLPAHERARIAEACTVLAPHLAIVEALGGVEAAAAALGVVTPIINGGNCDRCGTLIEGRDNRTKFCLGCQREMKRARGLRTNDARNKRVAESQRNRLVEECATNRPTPGEERVMKSSHAARAALQAMHVVAP
jgi:hypothetical protein